MFTSKRLSSSLPKAWNIDQLRPHRDKSLPELLNSLTVFRLCTFKPLVKWTPSLLESAEKLKVSAPIYSLVKHTFYRHFCGGEDLSQVRNTMERLARNRIGGILDYAIEADIDSGEKTLEQAKKQAEFMADTFITSVDVAATQEKSFIAIKVTAFVPPTLLLKWSNTLMNIKQEFTRFDTDKDGVLSKEECQRFLTSVFSVNDSEAAEIYKKLLNNPTADWITVSDKLSPLNKDMQSIFSKPKNESFISHKDFELIEYTFNQMLKLCNYGKEKQVRLMVDAEQTYLQPAIDAISLKLCEKVNNDLGPIVFNTYQLYLKDAYQRLVTDVSRAERNGYSLGIKIVRGAYMIEERERAQEMNYPDPINEDIQKTHTEYNKAIEFLVQKLSEYNKTTEKKQLSFVIASHNKNSVRIAVESMEKFGVRKEDGTVGFGQLLGMQDGTSNALAENGYKVYKYIPYGPVQVTIPYLVRRAQENSSVLQGGAAEDIADLHKELSRRLRMSP